MNPNEQKIIPNEKSSNSNLGGLMTKEKGYTLQGFLNRLNKTDPSTYGNYFVDFGEMFPEGTDYQGYLKKCTSLFNNDSTEKKQYKNNTPSFLKPTYFGKFSNETLFYIFYYMPRDSLQLFAAEELYKRKWRYHTDYSIWFTQENASDNTDRLTSMDSFLYFNPNEWKVMKFVYGQLNVKGFLLPDEIVKYIKQLNIDK